MPVALRLDSTFRCSINRARQSWNTTGNLINTVSNTSHIMSDGVNGTPRVGGETRPKTIVVDYQMNMYGTITDAGSAELAQLIAVMTGKLDTSIFETIPFRKVWMGGE